MAARYHFISTYTLTSDRAAVWSALVDNEAWPTWWRWLSKIEELRAPSTPDGVGAIYRNHVKAPTGYGFVYDTEIVEVDPLRRIDGRSTGDIDGLGRFLLADAPGGGTDLTFAWLVATPKWWMNLLAPIARPAFTWNHDKLMTDFGIGLARVSGGSVRSSRNETVKPGAPGFHVMPPLE